MHTDDQHWVVELKDGVRICVQPTLDQMTTYILLEQEDWFEDEIGFVRTYVKPQMNALDIGASYGVYGLTIARRLASGHVWAIEPTTVAGSMLARSIQLNGLSEKMTWVHAALSDYTGQGQISTPQNTELSTINQAAEKTEQVRTLTLDDLVSEYGIDVAIDLVKLDVEGHELNVIKGGRGFFNRQSPLVLFEFKTGDQINNALPDAFRQLGYRVLRLAPGLGILTDYDASFQDPYLLNLFACKPDRADYLSDRNLLAPADRIRAWLGQGPSAAIDWEGRIQAFPYAQELYPTWQSIKDRIPSEYLKALTACMQCQDPKLSAVHRLGLLQLALEILEALTRSGATNPGVWLTKLTALDLFGYRAAAVRVASQLLPVIRQAKTPPWPFLVPVTDLTARRPISGAGLWTVGSLAEFIETRRAFSSYFKMGSIHNMEALARNPNHSLAIDRRIILGLVRGKRELRLSASHPIFDQKSSRNALIWRRICFGRLGETLLAPGTKIHVLDIGASSHGRFTEPYAPLLLLGLARVTGFEPNQAECTRLNEMYGHDQDCRYIPAFVGSGGMATFYQTNWHMTGSLLAPNRPLLEAFEQVCDVTRLVTTDQVQTVCLANLPEINDIDMIKIDVQGAELQVFQGAGAKLDQVLVIWTEVEFLPLYEGQPLFSEVETFLRNKGFLFYNFDHIACRTYKPYPKRTGIGTGRRQALWADAIFVRDFQRFEGLSIDKLKKLAVLLHLVVQSKDLCYRVLTLIDGREGTRYAQQYLAGAI